MFNLTNAETIKNLLLEAGTQPSRASGQNFLISEQTVQQTINALPPEVAQVTELGAGLGTLTQALAAAGKKIKAIEQDDILIKILPQSIPDELKENVEIIHGDLRQIPWTWENNPYVLIGNIPYNLSGYIFRKLTELSPAPERAIFMVQKEVAQRLIAKAPNMNLLALAVGLWGQATIISLVPPHCFWPQPQVSSALIMVTPHKQQLFSQEKQRAIMKLARILFQTKRKQIGKRLKEIVGEETAQHILHKAQLQSQARPQELNLEQWSILSEIMTE